MQVAWQPGGIPVHCFKIRLCKFRLRVPSSSRGDQSSFYCWFISCWLLNDLVMVFGISVSLFSPFFISILDTQVELMSRTLSRFQSWFEDAIFRYNWMIWAHRAKLVVLDIFSDKTLKFPKTASWHELSLNP